MPKAMDFTSISTRVPRGSREWTSRYTWPDRTDMLADYAYCLSGRRSTPSFAVERGCGCGIGGLPLLVCEAAHHGWGVCFPVCEEACADAAVPSREP
jgi:hypothetical protein